MKDAIITRLEHYEFRAHSLGKIITKSGKVTKTMQNELHKKYTEIVDGIRKDIHSKYFEKGLLMEEDGLDLLQRTIYKGKLLVKNKDRNYNGFVQGEHDTIAPDGILYDIKNAWDKDTFRRASLTWEYKWQLKAYMWLTGAKQSRLFYCLNDMPEILLMDEEKKLFYSGHYIDYDNPDYQKACEKMRKKYVYDNMEDIERFKVWDVYFEDGDIDRMKDAVKESRKILTDIREDEIANVERNKKLMGI